MKIDVQSINAKSNYFYLLSSTLIFNLDLVQTIGYFNYVNRIVAGLGVKLGVGEGAPGSL